MTILVPQNALLAFTPPESQHMPKYVRGELTEEPPEELSRAAPARASQCRRRHRATPGAEFPEHVQVEPRRVPITRPGATRRANVGQERHALGEARALLAQPFIPEFLFRIRKIPESSGPHLCNPVIMRLPRDRFQVFTIVAKVEASSVTHEYPDTVVHSSNIGRESDGEHQWSGPEPNPVTWRLTPVCPRIDCSARLQEHDDDIKLRRMVRN